MYFFDSSALVKCYITEQGSSWVRNLCDVTAGHTFYIARITGAEVIAAIARRMRMGDKTPTAAQRAMAAFRTDFAGVYLIFQLTPALIERAMDWAQACGLRGYDAIQLAAALDVHTERSGCSLPLLMLVSAYTDLNAAAIAEGLIVDNPNDHP